MPEFEVGARLELKNLSSFVAGMRAAGKAVDDVGDQANQSSAALARMGAVGRGVGRAGLMSLKYGALAAGVALAGIATGAIKGHIEAERVGAQTTAVIKSTGGAANVSAKHVNNLANEVMGFSGISDEGVASAQNLLLTFTQISNEAGKGGAVFDRTTKLAADMSTALGTDIKSSALMLGKALNDPAAGLSRLTRAGVVFTEEQKKMVERLSANGQTIKAQGVILDEVAREFGGSARAMGKTAEGQFNIMKETVGNSLEEIGAKLVPIAQDVMPGLTKVLTSVLDALGPSIGKIADALAVVAGPLLKALTPVITVLADAFASLARVLAPIIKVFGGIFARVMKMASPLIEKLVKVLGAGLLKILKALAPSIPPLIRATLKLLRAFMPLVPVIADIIVLLVKLSGPVIKQLAKIVGWIADWVIRPITKLLKGLVTNWSDTWDTIKDVVGDAVGAVVNFAKGLVNGVINVINALTSGLNDALEVKFEQKVFGKTIGVHFDPPDIPQIPLLAEGGRALANRVHIVGERGPELFKPDQSGTVIPNDALGGGLTIYGGLHFHGVRNGRQAFREFKHAVDTELARA